MSLLVLTVQLLISMLSERMMIDNAVNDDDAEKHRSSAKHAFKSTPIQRH
jgi:hypothetical protein